MPSRRGLFKLACCAVGVALLAALASGQVEVSIKPLFAKPSAAPLHVLGDVPAVEVSSAAVSWVSAGRLWVMGADGAPEALSGQRWSASNPEWSYDGNWLAFLEQSPAGRERLELEAPRVGISKTLVSGSSIAFMWSPAADQLAYTMAGGGLWITGVDGETVQLLPAGSALDSFDWSPIGDYVAFSVPRGRSSQLMLERPVGATEPQVAWQSPPGTLALLASWWPNEEGVLVWLERAGSASWQGLGLWAVGFHGGARFLASTFVFLPWVTWAPGGSKLAVVAGAGLPWEDKRILVCEFPSFECEGLPQPQGVVDLDPAWSPDGSELAFVRAEAKSTLPPGVTVDAWYPTRHLWIAKVTWVPARRIKLSDRTGAAEAAMALSRPRAIGAQSAPRGRFVFVERQLRLPGAVASPCFIGGGTEIGFSTPHSVEVVSAAGGPPVFLASQLSGVEAVGAGPDGYGKTPWGGLAVWAGPH